VLMAAMMGERNYEDSKRKAAATAAGKRRAAERGESTGSVPDGYKIMKVADGTIVSRSVEQDPERKHVYRLIWDLALDGVTVRSIVRELAAARCVTAPRKAKPRPFDATRVDKVLKNPFYAGLMVSRGEIIGAGKWEGYLEPDGWHRLQAERKARTRHRSDPVGRPPGALLARLAHCECGAAMSQQRGGQRKDGSRKRTYVCITHMHRRDGCSALPFDAEAVERIILGGLDSLLGDAGAWADALFRGRDAERVRLAATVSEAAREVAECERVIQKLIVEFDTAMSEGEQGKVELAQAAWDRRRQMVDRATLRQKAAEDALAVQEDESEQDADLVLARMWEALSGELQAVKDEVSALNAALRRWFERFELRHTNDGVRIVPVLSADAAQVLLRREAQDEHPKHSLSFKLFSPGYEPHEELERDGQVVGYAPLGAINRAHDLHDLSPEPSDQPQYRVSLTTGQLTAERSGQPDKQHLSRLPHNTRRGSSRGTAGGSPRRRRTGGRDRSASSRS
jgi:hypothetical protein